MVTGVLAAVWAAAATTAAVRLYRRLRESRSECEAAAEHVHCQVRARHACEAKLAKTRAELDRRRRWRYPSGA